MDQETHTTSSTLATSVAAQVPQSLALWLLLLTSAPPARAQSTRAQTDRDWRYQHVADAPPTLPSSQAARDSIACLVGAANLDRRGKTEPTSFWSPDETLVAFSADAVTRGISVLTALMQEEDEDDRPTPHAFVEALPWVYAALMEFGDRLPDLAESVSVSGGIQIYWNGPERCVHLIVPASDQKKSVLYWDAITRYGSDELTNVDLLFSRLNWLARNARGTHSATI